MPDGDALLLTGATGFLGRRLLLERVRAGRPVFLLVQPEEIPRAHAAVARVTRRWPAARGSLLLFAGDVREPGLGLPTDVADRILAGTGIVVNALRFRPGVRRSAAAAAAENLRGVESLLAFAHRVRHLQAFVQVGSVEMSGDYPGTFYEDWYDVGQGFTDALDRSVFEAEGRVREARRTLPTLVVRPGLMLGDAETGAVDPDGGFGRLVRVLHALRRWPGRLPWPAPEGERRWLPLSPVDFVARAVLALATLKEARGHAHCLADPASPTLQAFLDGVAAAAGASRFAWRPPAELQSRVLALPGVLPGVARAGERLGLPLRAARWLVGRNRHDVSRATAALGPLDVVCPPFESYLGRLVESHLRAVA